MGLAIMTETLPEAEIRNGRKGETGKKKERREGTGKGIEVGIGIQREVGTRTEIGRRARTGRRTGTGIVMVVRRKGIVTGTAIIEIDTGIVVREGKGQGIEMTMIITEVVTLTGKSLFGILSELELEGFHQHQFFSRYSYCMQCIICLASEFTLVFPKL